MLDMYLLLMFKSSEEVNTYKSILCFLSIK